MLLAASLRAASPIRKTNIVFILADDLGWRDTSLYGSKYFRTPNIDRLASRGMMFTQAYAASPLCSPTRSSIMTGQYPARIGITLPTGHVPETILEKSLVKTAPASLKALEAISLTRLKQEYFTIAEALKEAGYATAHYGKWHLGPEPYDPLHQGFDVDLPHTPVPGPVGGYLAPWEFWPGMGQPGEHIEDRLSKEAAKFIAANHHRPFYVNYWAFSVHTPWQAKPELIEKYRAQTDPSDAQRNPVYAAMVETLDDAVGRIVQAVDDAGVADDTAIFFTSDNGGVDWNASQEPSMLNLEFKDLRATSNAPLRAGKGTLYEGGTREPSIVVWPGKIRPGSRSEQVIMSIDYYPTILAMAGLRPKPGLQLDGVSLVPALSGQALAERPLFCHFPHYVPRTAAVPGTWVREGDWKLIRFFCDNDDQTDRFELYNLRTDVGETDNLAPNMPEKVKELNALIGRFLRETEAVVPQPNPAYNRSPGYGD
jgi:arylsulfatase A-like enzyme